MSDSTYDPNYFPFVLSAARSAVYRRVSGKFQARQSERDQGMGAEMKGQAYKPAKRGFTLIELLVVMAIIATLLTLAVPKYFHSLDKSREAVLRQDLSVMRDAIDKYFADRGRYPDTLEDLAAKRYLRKVPVDPITESTDTWIVLPPPDSLTGGVYDIRSGAQGNALDGTRYEEW